MQAKNLICTICIYDETSTIQTQKAGVDTYLCMYMYT